MEAEEFAKLFGSPINRALLNVFFLTDRNKKEAGVGQSAKPRKIASAGVVGAGVMGQGIAAANVKRSIPVALMDTDQAAIARGVQGVLNEVAYNKQLKGADVKRAVELAPLVNGTLSDVELAARTSSSKRSSKSAMPKQRLFARIEPLTGDDAILCSNTSTIPITQLADGLEHPERFCGLHFFNPVRQMPLVEVIRGRKTSDATIATAVAYASSLGKSPIVVNDGPGFLVNRLLLPYMNEAALLLCEGASIKDIERAAKVVRHADGADHAVRRGRARRGRSRRPHDGRGVSRPRRAGPDRATSWSNAAASARRRAKASSTTAGQRRQAAARHR